MKRRIDQHGTALMAVLIIMMILLPVGAFVVMQCRTDLLVHHNLRAEAEVFSVAEAGLDHALADIAPGGSFAGLLAGPDHVAGNADDGFFPFIEGLPAAFPASPLRYDVRVSSVNAGMVQLLSTGVGRNGATKVIEALVARAPLPFTPGALYVQGDASTLDLGSGGFLLSGYDHVAGDVPNNPTGTAAAIPALAASDARAEPSLRAGLPPGSASRVVGKGGAPSIATGVPIDLQALAARCASQPGSVQLSGAAVGAGASLGTASAPQVSITADSVDVTGSISGAGVLIVQGTLHVSGALAFTGVVLAMGGVSFEPASTVTVTGAFWRAASQDARLSFNGGGAVLYSSTALAAIDQAFAGLLPHAAVMVGWQEQL
jgi:hypothetical protein